MTTEHRFLVRYKGDVHFPILADRYHNWMSGSWCSGERAIKFATKQDAETALKEVLDASVKGTWMTDPKDYVVEEIGTPPVPAPAPRKVKGYAVYYVPGFTGELALKHPKWWCYNPDRGCGPVTPRHVFSKKEDAEKYRAERVKQNGPSSAERFHLVTIYVKPRQPKPPVDPNAKLDQLREWLQAMVEFNCKCREKETQPEQRLQYTTYEHAYEMVTRRLDRLRASP